MRNYYAAMYNKPPIALLHARLGRSSPRHFNHQTTIICARSCKQSRTQIFSAKKMPLISRALTECL
jgi:hypothetical protein